MTCTVLVLISQTDQYDFNDLQKKKKKLPVKPQTSRENVRKIPLKMTAHTAWVTSHLKTTRLIKKKSTKYNLTESKEDRHCLQVLLPNEAFMMLHPQYEVVDDHNVASKESKKFNSYQVLCGDNMICLSE